MQILPSPGNILLLSLDCRSLNRKLRHEGVRGTFHCHFDLAQAAGAALRERFDLVIRDLPLSDCPIEELLLHRLRTRANPSIFVLTDPAEDASRPACSWAADPRVKLLASEQLNAGEICRARERDDDPSPNSSQDGNTSAACPVQRVSRHRWNRDRR